MGIKCTVAECPTPARRGGLCAKHGGNAECKEEDCHKYPRTGGFCLKHGGQITKCTVRGCPNTAQNNGVCTEHGAIRKKCSILDCPSYAHKDGLCAYHNTDPLWSQRIFGKLNKLEKERYRTDDQYKEQVLLRAKLYQIIVDEKYHSVAQELVGCSVENLLQHLQAQFENNMHWGNFGEWHIYYIKSYTKFDLTIPKQQTKCFHYTNLQPKWGSDSLNKGMQIDW